MARYIDSNTKFSNLHVRNVDTELKEEADQIAKAEGFNGLADAMRHFIKRYAKGSIKIRRTITIEEILEDRKNGAKYIKLKPGQTLKELVRDFQG